MDPPIINEASFSAANPSSYSLAEIWPFPINGELSRGGGGLGLRMCNFGAFAEANSNRDVSVDESTVTEQSGGGRKRRDANSEEDESSKLVSTSSAKDLLGAATFDSTGMLLGSQATREYMQGSQPEWLHMQVGSSFDRET
ncbi:transcription factor bHLH79-like [Camellia sinensis]|uniref:transcription factor bHLH79-like n=1 Tax=Camellia sinensis TaxID=4442 RepID=UPI00103552E7|nr:transcription factor bHLH79-like [Camellia sinensis]